MRAINPGLRMAVVGGGVAGLTAAWVLAHTAEVTMYEAQPRLGGHAHTHHLRARRDSTQTVAVDSGFIVFNDRTYPTLTRLFAELGIVTQEADMSMSVRCDGCKLEYAGARGVVGLFPGLRSLARPRYLSMLSQVKRFHRLACRELATATDASRTLGDFLRDSGFPAYFTAHFMVPLVAAVWSCAPQIALDYPVGSLLSFLDHHGMLTVFGSPTWRTVTGGSQTYVRLIAERLHQVRVATPVRTLTRHASGVAIRDAADRLEFFDAAVIATHPDQALALLEQPTAAETAILGAMPYSVNHTVLHTDASMLPRRRGARASWNYRLPHCTASPDRVLVSYDLTRLQRLGAVADRRFLVTLGDGDQLDPATVIDTMVYEHPQFTVASLAAQQRLPELGDARLVFAGAYHGWGFHEDGVRSGVAAAAKLGGRWVSATPACCVQVGQL